MTATDQRTADYFSSDPRRVFAARGDVSEDVRRAFANWCEATWASRHGVRPNFDRWFEFWTSGERTFENIVNADDVQAHEAASLLRCLIPPPDLGERVECPECEGSGSENRIGYRGYPACQPCHGSGSITLPFAVDERWLTNAVVDLVKVIRGRCPHHGDLCDEHKPRFDLMPRLADALEDAGCDCEAMIGHLRSDGPHVAGKCWVVKLLTTEGK